MTIEEEIQRMMELWNSIKPEAKGDLASLWEERRELGELEAIVEDVAPKVIKLLEVIPTLKRHSDEYRARTRDLIKLFHHFSIHKSSEEWVQKVTSDLDYISSKSREAVNEAIKDLRSRNYDAAKSTYTVDVFLRKPRDTKYDQELIKKVMDHISSNPQVIKWIDLYKSNKPLCLKLSVYYRDYFKTNVDGHFLENEYLSDSLRQIQKSISEAHTLFGSIKKGRLDATYFTDPDTGLWKELWGQLNNASQEDSTILDQEARRKSLEFANVKKAFDYMLSLRKKLS